MPRIDKVFMVEIHVKYKDGTTNIVPSSICTRRELKSILKEGLTNNQIKEILMTIRSL